MFAVETEHSGVREGNQAGKKDLRNYLRRIDSADRSRRNRADLIGAEIRELKRREPRNPSSAKTADLGREQGCDLAYVERCNLSAVETRHRGV